MAGTISRKLTGRGWGNKKPFAVIRTFTADHVKHAECEADFWCGPETPGQAGQYERIRWIEAAGIWADSEKTNLVPRRASTCSYENDLAKALR